MFCFPALILIRYFTVEWTAWILTASHLSNAWDVIAGQGNNCVWYFSISIQWNWTLFQHDALDFITKYIRPDSIYGLIFLWSRCIKCEYFDAVPNLYTRIMCVCVFRQKHPWCKTRTKHNFWSIKHLQFSYIKEWTHKNRETKEHFRAFCIKILWPSITFTIHVQIINNFSLKHYAFIKSHKMKTK